MSTDVGAAIPPRATRKEWLGLAVLAFPTMLIAMDLTVLHLALPTLTDDLRPSNAELLWIVDVYGFLTAGFLITMGAIGDRIGRRRLLLIGASVFGAASIFSAFASSAEALIASRALLGLAGATLMPSTLSLIRIMFQDPKQQGTAIGAWTGFFGLGTVIGPLVGGTFLETFWWGSVFLLAVPVMLLLIAFGPALLPEYRDASVARPDFLSAIMSVVGVLSLIYGLKRIAEDGPGTESGIAVAAGLVLGALFVSRQSRLEQPLVDLSLFRSKLFSSALGMLVLGTLISGGSQFFVMQYLQLVCGLSPVQAGLWGIPTTVAVMTGAMGAPALAARVKLSALLAGGLTIAMVGMILLTLVDGPSGQYLAVAGAAVIGLGLGPMISLGTGLIVGSAPPERAGAASAISSTGTDLGASTGIAVIGSIGFVVYRANLTDNLPQGLPGDVVETAEETLAAAVGAARTLPGGEGAALLSAARDAFVQGLQATALVGAGLAALLAVAAVILLRDARVPGPPPAAGAETPDSTTKPLEKADS